MAIEKTYSMIKPDGVRNGHIGEIINRFERAGLKIERMEMGMVTPEQAAANYAEHEGKPFYDGLISYITSGPVVKMVVSGEGAVKKCRSLMGATDPAEAAPGTIRGDFGLSARLVFSLSRHFFKKCRVFYEPWRYARARSV